MKAKDIRRKAFCLLFLVAAVCYFLSGTPLNNSIDTEGIG
jgi:hypothetical protein